MPTGSDGKLLQQNGKLAFNSILVAVYGSHLTDSYGRSSNGDPSGRHQGLSFDGFSETPSNSTVMPLGSRASKRFFRFVLSNLCLIFGKC